VTSYRVVLVVGLLEPGIDPAAVLPAAAAAVQAVTQVEARDLAVVAGEARVVVRYLASDDPTARRIGDRVRARVRELAQVGRATVDRRDGPRWVPVR
jgi:hypothetical protein